MKQSHPAATKPEQSTKPDLSDEAEGSTNVCASGAFAPVTSPAHIDPLLTPEAAEPFGDV